MSQKPKRVRRICEKVKSKCDLFKHSLDVCPAQQEKHTKLRPKTKKPTPSISSMMKFYENIPTYDDVRHLPDYVFSEKVQLLRKIHCDLSVPLEAKARSRPSSRCKRRTPPKKCVVSPSLCNSFSKTSLCDLDEVEENVEMHRTPSARSPSMCTPIRRLQLLRERLICDLNDFDPKYAVNSATPTSPKCHDIVRLNDCNDPLASYHMDSHPCDLYFPVPCPMDEMPRPKSSRQESSRAVSPVRSKPEPTDSVPDEKPPASGQKRGRRAKSCPRSLFGSTKPCLGWGGAQQTNRDNGTPCTVSSASTRPAKPKARRLKAKTPTTMDEYVSSKLVRTNLAANLRQQWSRQKIHDMTAEKIKATMHVSKFIPRCHQWDVRATPGWRTFAAEDTTAAQRMREAARREENRVRQHAHTTTMNIMRARVRSAQLLLEGRALQKY